MNSFEVITAPERLPIIVDDEQKQLALAVVEECERVILGRSIVRQERKILISGPLPSFLELEPIVSIVSFTMWTPTDDAAVIDAASYDFISRDPAGTIVFPDNDWPAPERSIGSFEIVYQCGFEVTDTSNSVPSSIQLMVKKAVEFREGSGLGDISIGNVAMEIHESYKTDRIPPEIASISRAWNYRHGIFIGRP